MWFLVVQNIEYCLIWAKDREDAKRQAKPYLERDADRYEVIPITPKEYRLKAILFDTVVINNKYKDL